MLEMVFWEYVIAIWYVFLSAARVNSARYSVRACFVSMCANSCFNGFLEISESPVTIYFTSFPEVLFFLVLVLRDFEIYLKERSEIEISKLV